MTDNMTSQNIDLSSWDTLYTAVGIVMLKTIGPKHVAAIII